MRRMVPCPHCPGVKSAEARACYRCTRVGRPKGSGMEVDGCYAESIGAKKRQVTDRGGAFKLMRLDESARRLLLHGIGTKH